MCEVECKQSPIRKATGEKHSMRFGGDFATAYMRCSRGLYDNAKCGGQGLEGVSLRGRERTQLTRVLLTWSLGSVGCVATQPKKQRLPDITKHYLGM